MSSQILSAEPLGQFQPNLAQNILVEREFIFVQAERKDENWVTLYGFYISKLVIIDSLQGKLLFIQTVY